MSAERAPEPARITRAVSPEAALDAALDGYVAPLDGMTMVEAVERIVLALDARGYQVRPSISIAFEPATVKDYYPGQDRVIWLWTPSGHITWHKSATEPPTPAQGWTMLWVQTKDGVIVR